MRDLQQLLVEGFRGFQVAAEWFFYNHPPPVIVFFGHKADGTELLDHGTEEHGSDCEVEKIVLMSAVIGVYFLQKFLQLLEGLRVAEVSSHVVQTALEPLFEFRIDLHVGKFL